VKMRSLYWGIAWCLLISSFNSRYFAPLLAISAIRNQHLLAMSCECSVNCAFAHILLVKHQYIPPGSTSRFSSLKLPRGPKLQQLSQTQLTVLLFYLVATPVWPEHMAQVAIPLHIQTE
jgi:multidrug efflux pump subunit AcrB